VAITCWLGVPTTASSQQPVGLDEVMALDQAFYKACGRRDAAVLRATMDAQYVLMNTQGQFLGREEVLESCVDNPAMIISVTPSYLQSRRFDDLVILHARVESLSKQEDGTELAWRWRSTRAYLKRGTVWQLVAEHRTPV
jgi:ketosteroid isomerase-like protein